MPVKQPQTQLMMGQMGTFTASMEEMLGELQDPAPARVLQGSSGKTVKMLNTKLMA